MKPVLLVTGGSQGIGAAVAHRAARAGYRVALSYANAQHLADGVVSAIREAGGEAMAVRADVAEEAQVKAMFEAVDRAFGPPAALVNNAGITGPVGRLDDVTAAAIDTVMGVNVRGAFLVLREAIARMAVDRGGAGGAIVNVSSRASELGGAGEWVHYAASKGAMDAMTIGAAKELAQRGVRVNAVNPGLIDTDLHARAGLPDRVERMKGGVPMGRSGSADEVAKVILWLLSDDASYVTGALVPVSGGR
jgi:NAD(P)-dependent dehydrogenase (short-subunit alcohol dehydrogenase family)